MKVLVVRTHQEKIRVRENESIFDLVVTNDSHQTRYIEGLRIKEVFITEDVLTHGLDAILFDRLTNTLISMSVDPMYAFRIYYRKKRQDGNIHT
jgi:hypothetical protein